MRTLMIAALLLAPSIAAANTIETVLAEAAAECAAFENGAFSLRDGAITPVELTGESPPEMLIDFAAFDCSSVTSLWGGTGGSPISVLANGTRTNWLALDWQAVETGYDRVLLLSLHGSECDAVGSQPCYEAAVWGGEGFLSIRRGQTPPEPERLPAKPNRKPDREPHESPAD